MCTSNKVFFIVCVLNYCEDIQPKLTMIVVVLCYTTAMIPCALASDLPLFSALYIDCLQGHIATH